MACSALHTFNTVVVVILPGRVNPFLLHPREIFFQEQLTGQMQSQKGPKSLEVETTPPPPPPPPKKKKKKKRVQFILEIFTESGSEYYVICDKMSAQRQSRSVISHIRPNSVKMGRHTKYIKCAPPPPPWTGHDVIFFCSVDQAIPHDITVPVTVVLYISPKNCVFATVKRRKKISPKIVNKKKEICKKMSRQSLIYW